MAALVDEPELVTVEQMDRWCADFDNWALCDTVCFSLFDRTPPAWTRLEPWARDDREFVRRAAFALLWSLALHDTSAADAQFVEGLALSSSTPRRAAARHEVDVDVDARRRATKPLPAGGRPRYRRAPCREWQPPCATCRTTGPAGVFLTVSPAVRRGRPAPVSRAGRPFPG